VLLSVALESVPPLPAVSAGNAGWADLYAHRHRSRVSRAERAGRVAPQAALPGHVDGEGGAWVGSACVVGIPAQQGLLLILRAGWACRHVGRDSEMPTFSVYSCIMDDRHAYMIRACSSDTERTLKDYSFAPSPAGHRCVLCASGLSLSFASPLLRGCGGCMCLIRLPAVSRHPYSGLALGYSG
jgi:hypothetical protein